MRMTTSYTQQVDYNNLFISMLIPTDFSKSQTISVFPDLDTPRVSLNHIFVSSNIQNIYTPGGGEAFETMLASEEVLGRDWNEPDEDEAWVDL